MSRGNNTGNAVKSCFHVAIYHLQHLIYILSIELSKHAEIRFLSLILVVPDSIHALDVVLHMVSHLDDLSTSCRKLLEIGPEPNEVG
jgi:hypothetical protein